MATINQILEAAKANNVKTEETNGYIGLSYTAGVWHWFYIIRSKVSPDYISFDHTYSQNTGSIKKGFRRGLRVIERLEKKLKINWKD